MTAFGVCYPRVKGDTVLAESFGLLDQDLDENGAGPITDAMLWAWRNGYRKVGLVTPLDGLHLWGVLPVSNVTLNLQNSLIHPYVPAEPEGSLGYHAITIFAFGGHALRVPEAWVSRYGLRSETIVNHMLADPDVVCDHRYLHPDSPNPVPGVTWIEFAPGMVFDPDGYTVQTNGVSTLVPGQMVYLFRPRYLDVVDQSMAAPNIVDYVDGETVHFRHKLMGAFSRDPLYAGTAEIFGGIATVPDDFMIVNSHIRNFRVDISNVPVGPHIVNLWKVGPAFGCSCTDFEAVGEPDGAPWVFALHPKGRNNYIGGLRKSGKRSRIIGRGSMVANDQGNHNDWEHLDVVLTNWAFEYLGGNGYSSLPGHFHENSSIRLRHVSFIGPDYDADTPDYNGADLTQGTLNEFENVTMHNVTNSLLQFTQVNGYGQLKARDVRITGYLQGPVISIGLADGSGTGATRSNQLALDFDRVDVDVLTPPVALTTLDAVNHIVARASTDASIRNATMRITDTETGEETVWGTTTGWMVEYDGEQSAAGVIGPDTWQYLAERLVFAHNVGLPEIRWRHYGVDILNTEGTKSVLNNYISLVSNAITYFRFSINEPDQQCVGLLYRLRLSDPAGVGGTAFFQGSLNCATTADPDAPATRTLKPTATELTLAAGTGVQRVALPVVRGGSVGYIPIGTVTLWRRANEGTAGALYLRGVDVLFIGGR